MKTQRSSHLALVVFCLVILLAGCTAIQKGTEVLSGGAGTAEDLKEASEVAKKIRSTFADITEEEEYFIGRAVSALILSKYPVYENQAVVNYVNTVGNAVVFFSDRPEIYAGYHFLILDDEEVNALAAPGGFIFLTKGLLKRCADEEMLAAILAHEVGHVCAKHGLQSIKKSRLVDAFRILGQQAAQKFGPQELAQLTSIFEDVLGDIAEKLVERGYDRKYEYEADERSVKFAANMGYSPQGLVDFLQTMVGDSSAEAAKGWFKTHPTPEDRMGKVQKLISGLASIPPKENIRTARFKQSMAGLK